jgi:hypothetical protein
MEMTEKALRTVGIGAPIAGMDCGWVNRANRVAGDRGLS